MTCGGDTLHFYYDAQGRPQAVKFDDGQNDGYYDYVHNLQRDIVGIVDATGASVVE